MKRAAIYVRVSTELQATKASPEEQERTCRAHCERNGYIVEQIYSDTEKYRANGRMVEPSGTRSDRPQFQRMLKAFDAGQFDVLVAFREDRLYRGVTNAVIELKERTKRKPGLTIETVNGGFNVQTMEVLAWAAGIENEARVERRRLGMARRMAEGKVVMANAPFGYTYNKATGFLEINEAEAETVRQIWAWYGAGIARYEIQRRLRNGGMLQRDNTAMTKRKYAWSIGVIDGIVKNDSYCTGLHSHKLNGETYLAPIPKIVGDDDYQAVLARRKRWKDNPVGNIKTPNLLLGKIYCQSCGVRMHVRRRTPQGNQKLYLYYSCNANERRSPSSDCCKAVRLDIADTIVWGSLWEILTEPGRFETAIQQRMRELQAEEVHASTDIERIERELDDIVTTRQKLIGWALDGKITEDDLPYRLEPLTMQEKLLKRQLQDKRMLTGNQAARLMELVDIFRQQVQDDLKALHPNAIPVDEKQAAEQHKTKQRFIDALVNRVVILPDKSYRIEMQMGLSPLPELRDDSLLVNLPLSGSRYSDKQTFSFFIDVAATMAAATHS